MRWVALGVDYEMYGKDLIDSGVQSGKIATALGGRKPEGLIYEMFLDEKGEKISKSKGNGLSLDQWLDYGSEESLAFFAYREPKTAKQLHIGVIPRRSTNICSCAAIIRRRMPTRSSAIRCTMSTSRAAGVPATDLPVTFGLLLNLVGVMGADASKDADLALSRPICRRRRCRRPIPSSTG